MHHGPSSRAFRLISILIVLLVLGLGCRRSLSRSITFDRLEGGAGEEVLTHEHEGSWTRVELRLRVRLRGGTVTATLKDPKGVVRWHQVYSGRTADREHRRLPAMDGPWTLTLGFDDADGSYQATLASSG